MNEQMTDPKQINTMYAFPIMQFPSATVSDLNNMV